MPPGVASRAGACYSGPMAVRGWRIQGRVQGVGFRAFVCDRARELGLRGWVRNRADGSVEAAAAGPEAALDRLGPLLLQGPPRARVDRAIPFEPPKSLEDEREFAIQYGAGV